MRNRLFVIASLTVAALSAASSTVAHAGPPKGPGNMGQPTTTTTQPKPQGPGDIAPAPKNPQPPADPQDDNGVEPGPDTTGNGSGNLPGDPSYSDHDNTTGGNGATGSEVSVERASVDGDSDSVGVETGTETASTPLGSHPSRMMAWVLAGLAALVALVIAGLVIPSRRTQDADAEQR